MRATTLKRHVDYLWLCALNNCRSSHGNRARRRRFHDRFLRYPFGRGLGYAGGYRFPSARRRLHCGFGNGFSFHSQTFHALGQLCINVQEVTPNKQQLLSGVKRNRLMLMRRPATLNHDICAGNRSRRIAAKENRRASNLGGGYKLFRWLCG